MFGAALPNRLCQTKALFRLEEGDDYFLVYVRLTATHLPSNRNGLLAQNKNQKLDNDNNNQEGK